MMTFQARDACLLLLLLDVLLQVDFAAGQTAPDFVIENQNEASCMTTEGKNGNCLSLTVCKYAMDIITKTGIGSRDSQNFLRPNQCGFEGNSPKVCCPQENGQPTERNPTTEKVSSTQQQPEVGNDLDVPYENPSSLLPAKCGEDQSNRIIGGEVTELDEFPWMAVLEYQQGAYGKSAGCGGALISKRYVLTAAHCIRSIPSTWRLVNVRLGEYDMRTDPDCVDEGNGEQTCADPMLSVPVEREIVHENYMSPAIYRHDIALLRLAYDIAFTRYIQPICLPEDGNPKALYFSAGWGQIEYKASSDVKLKVSMPYFDSNKCAAIYSSRKVVLGDGQMCAGGRAGKDTCKGDSGGPLMKQTQQTGRPNRWVVEGVVSIGNSPCGLPGWPGVYTKVFNYVPWIRSKLRP